MACSLREEDPHRTLTIIVCNFRQDHLFVTSHGIAHPLECQR